MRPSEADAAAQLADRTRQQSLVAEFGRFVLGGATLAELMQEAARLAAAGLDAPLSKVLEYLPAEGVLLIRAGVGWRAGTVGHIRFGPGAASPAGFALMTGTATVSNAIAADGRFRIPALLEEHNVRRVVNIVIRGDGAPFGVLEVDDTDDGVYTADDIIFLETLANMLGLALERERDRAERARLAEQRETLLAERGLLLAGIHHHVKNSLQLVHTVLMLQANDAENDAVYDLLQQTAHRVLTIAAVHERLYQASDFATVDIRQYLIGLVEGLRAGLVDGLGPARSVSIEADDAFWPPRRAQALGMILTELVTNAMKYGDGGVRVHFSAPAGNGAAQLVIEDDGPGLPPGFDPSLSTGLGMRMVWALVQDQRGALEVGAEGRARFTATLPDPVTLDAAATG